MGVVWRGLDERGCLREGVASEYPGRAGQITCFDRWHGSLVHERGGVPCGYTSKPARGKCSYVALQDDGVRRSF